MSCNWICSIFHSKLKLSIRNQLQSLIKILIIRILYTSSFDRAQDSYEKVMPSIAYLMCNKNHIIVYICSHTRPLKLDISTTRTNVFFLHFNGRINFEWAQRNNNNKNKTKWKFESQSLISFDDFATANKSKTSAKIWKHCNIVIYHHVSPTCDE